MSQRGQPKVPGFNQEFSAVNYPNKSNMQTRSPVSHHLHHHSLKGHPIMNETQTQQHYKKRKRKDSISFIRRAADTTGKI